MAESDKFWYNSPFAETFPCAKNTKLKEFAYSAVSDFDGFLQTNEFSQPCDKKIADSSKC